MNIVRMLPVEVSEKIAAGEVIERPASALKELIENSLDAGADNICIEALEGGKKYIKVTDNGRGMSKEDARLSLLRHATSKIATVNDIGSIMTLGFRGEALPSIAAVSSMVLRTKSADSSAGTELYVDAGVITEEKEAGLPQGTTVEVTKLFYNLPARRSFLKSDTAEMDQISKLFTWYALCYPEVSFTLVCEASEKVLPKESSMGARVQAVLNLRAGEELIALEHENNGVKVTGFTSFPHHTTAVKNRQYLFVNKRPVFTSAISMGVTDAYHRSIAAGRHPMFVLFLQTDPSCVDVNIHPAKNQVKFKDERLVRDTVFQAVEQALKSKSYFIPASHDKPPFLVKEQKAWHEPLQAEPFVLPAQEPQPDVSGTGKQPAAQNPAQNFFSHENEPGGLPEFLGVIKDAYILCKQENEGTLMVIDLHAAHERVLFDQYLDLFQKKKIVSQVLLLPPLLKLNPEESLFLEEQASVLQGMGFEIGQMGAGTYIVEAVPEILKESDIERALTDILDELAEDRRNYSYKDRWEEHVLKKVCRCAVKFGKHLNKIEAEGLMRSLMNSQNRHTCPHGRPTVKTFSFKELNHFFSRK